jgi:hypothetical protein
MRISRDLPNRHVSPVRRSDFYRQTRDVPVHQGEYKLIFSQEILTLNESPISIRKVRSGRVGYPGYIIDL